MYKRQHIPPVPQAGLNLPHLLAPGTHFGECIDPMLGAETLHEANGAEQDGDDFASGRQPVFHCSIILSRRRNSTEGFAPSFSPVYRVYPWPDAEGKHNLKYF